jgi:hypothetical protein
VLARCRITRELDHVQRAQPPDRVSSARGVDPLGRAPAQPLVRQLVVVRAAQQVEHGGDLRGSPGEELE